VSGSNPNFPVCKRATYQGCEVIVSERMKVIPIQWVRDLGIGPVGKCHRRHRMPDTTRNVPFAVRRIDCPIPVRKSHSVSDFQGFVSWCAFRVLVSDIHCAIVQNLLEKRKIRPMPRPEQTARMRAVAHHMLVALVRTSHTVPFSERNAMNTWDLLEMSEAV
jgi:hypothetical protein